MPTEIRKVLITAASSDPSVVKVTSANLPDPALDEIQIQVLYAGFNGSDINMRLGVYPLQRKAPLTPGYCCVGRVHLKGKNTSTKFKSGDIVAALTVYDSEATYTNIPEKYLMSVSEEMDMAKVCALVLDWTTAYGMVHRSAKVKQGDRVFVHGMSGAVGQAVMTLCLARGAIVYGTASARNHDEIRKLGGHPFVYTDKAWIEEMKKLDVSGKGLTAVFDPLGFESWDESFSVLSNHVSSRLVGYGGNLRSLDGGDTTRSVIWPTTKLLARNLSGPFCKKSTSFFYVDRDQKTFKPEFEELLGLLQRKEIDVGIKRVLSLDEVPAAHEEWTRMVGMGSVVVKISEPGA